MSLLLRQLFDSSSCTYSYLLGDTLSSQALLIDPVYEQYNRDEALIRELGLQLVLSVDTHCHADHVSAAYLLKQHLGCKIAASERGGIQGLDRSLNHGDRLDIGNLRLDVRATPGHTNGCITLVLADQSLAFTGDCLLIRGCGRTDFQQGSAATLFRSITEQIFTLPDQCLIYPGHDYQGRAQSSVGEERQFNPRIGGDANETDFIGYMENMRLPHPKRLDEAVPANLMAGRPADGRVPRTPDWAPVVTTYSGILEVSPEWVATHLDQVAVLDVRNATEQAEEPVQIAGAINIPLNQLRDRLTEIPQDRPVIALCRSGRRSAMAFTILREEGWEQVANVQGGLLHWHAEGLPA
tara:strand:- start:70 stop:1128 length:1059 start_codon:yes stop_codon:yes gene_type:complete